LDSSLLLSLLPLNEKAREPSCAASLSQWAATANRPTSFCHCCCYYSINKLTGCHPEDNIQSSTSIPLCHGRALLLRDTTDVSVGGRGGSDAAEEEEQGECSEVIYLHSQIYMLKY
jgi:hypothetical protein